MKKLLFPFSSEKYKFLEKKWGHRLIKVIFFIMLVAFAFVSYLLSKDILEANIIDKNYQVNSKDIADFIKIEYPDLMSDKNITKESILEKAKLEYPKVFEIELEKAGKLMFINFSKETPGVTEVINIRTERIEKLKTLHLIGTVLITLISIYIINILIQIMYYKGVIYIIYGSRKNEK